MNCINCGANTYEFGIYKGDNIIYCTNCKTHYDFKNGTKANPIMSKSVVRRLDIQKGEKNGL